MTLIGFKMLLPYVMGAFSRKFKLDYDMVKFVIRFDYDSFDQMSQHHLLLFSEYQ